MMIVNLLVLWHWVQDAAVVNNRRNILNLVPQHLEPDAVCTQNATTLYLPPISPYLSFYINNDITVCYKGNNMLSSLAFIMVLRKIVLPLV